MAQYQTDEEQLEILKNWWKQNGSSLVLTVVVALSAYFGWQWWSQHQANYSQGASALFEELTEALNEQNVNEETLSEDNLSTANFLIERLHEEYGNSFYAVSASLIAAKLAVEEGDLAKAEEALNKAYAEADADLQPIVALRLGRVYLAQEKYDEALAMAAYKVKGESDSFTTLFAILKGDILKASQQQDAARDAYQLALDSMEPGRDGQRRIVEIKLSDLGEGDAS